MTPSKRLQAVAWWQDQFFVDKWEYMLKHKHVIGGDPFSRSPDNLSGKEIEGIWREEMLTKELANEHYNAEYLQSSGRETDVETWMRTGKQVWNHPSKANKKQFKSFNKELFLAYIDKFSEEDKQKALETLREHLEK